MVDFEGRMLGGGYDQNVIHRECLDCRGGFWEGS